MEQKTKSVTLVARRVVFIHLPPALIESERKSEFMGFRTSLTDQLMLFELEEPDGLPYKVA